MMEHINEFIKNFRERLASPFFFSFLVSWTCFNWKVTVALLWYNAELFSKNRSDLISYIEANTSNWQSIVLPFISAVLYTGLLRNMISAFATWASKWGSNWNLSISKESSVPMSKFIAYRNLYIETNNTLERVIKDESKVIEESDKLRKRSTELEAINLTVQSEISQLRIDNEKLKLQLDSANRRADEYKGQNEMLNENFKNYQNLNDSLKDVTFLNGRWKFGYNNSMQKLNFNAILEIKDGVVSTVEGDRIENKYRIVEYFYDAVNKKILIILNFFADTPERTFIQKLYANPEIFQATTNMEYTTYHRLRYEPALIHQLDVKNEGKVLSGTENVVALISYEKFD